MSVLVGCGFQPLYDQRRAASVPVEAFDRIYVAPIDDRLGVLLRAEVRRALGEKSGPKPDLYTLSIKAREKTQSLGVAKDATATRANLLLDATVVLVNAEGEGLFMTSVDTSVSYNLLAETYATVEARHDAQRRGTRELAHQIRAKLAVFFLRRSEDHGQDQSQRR